MRILLLATALLTRSLDAAEEAPVRIRPVWWQAPAAPIQLHVEDTGDKHRPIRVLQMCPLESFGATMEKGAVLLQRIEPDPADPKSKPRWEPYASAPLPQGSRDLLMLLLPSPGGKSAQARLVPMDEDTLRWGGTRLVNLTAARLVGQVADKPFSVAPGGSTVLPFVATQRSVVEIMLAADTRAGREMVFSSKGIFSPTKRTLLFIVNGAEKGSYETRAIEEPNPDPKVQDASEAGG